MAARLQRFSAQINASPVVTSDGLQPTPGKPCTIRGLLTGCEILVPDDDSGHSVCRLEDADHVARVLHSALAVRPRMARTVSTTLAPSLCVAGSSSAQGSQSLLSGWLQRLKDTKVTLTGAQLLFVALADLALLFGVGSFSNRLGFARGTRAHVKACNPFRAFGVHPPIFKFPQVDVDGDNNIVEVCFGATDTNDVEVTVIFKDEDRPNPWEDFLYDYIRRPLFGRFEDLETFTFVRGAGGEFESIRFEGTYCGDQTWQAKLPKHENATLPLSEFEKEGDRLVIWVNVWNHLFGPRNNNPSMEIYTEDIYKCSFGTRNETDDRYCGLITKIA